MTDVRTQAETGRLIAAERAAALQNGTDDFLNGLLNQAWATRTEGVRTVISMRLTNWRKDKEYLQYAAEWLKAANSQIDDWQRETRARLGRRARSMDFLAAFPDDADMPDQDPSVRQAAKTLKRRDSQADIGDATAGIESVGEALRMIDDQSVIDLGLRLGEIFSATDAIQIAADIADFGADVLAVGYVIDLFRLSRTLHREWARHEEQRTIIKNLRDDGQECARALAHGTGNRPGALSGISAACDDLDSFAKSLAAEQSTCNRTMTRISERLTIYQKLIDEAREEVTHG
jgi:hypothetical protein